MQIEHLSSAPIKEAVIELRFEHKIDLDILRDLERNLPKGYSELQPIVQKEFGFTFQGGEIKSDRNPSGLTTGYRSDNEQLKTVVVFETDKFRFSKLAPYSTWEDFKSQAMAIWQLFKPNQESIVFSRIAARYINEILLPLDGNSLNFDDYLTTCPKVPLGMPDVLAKFLCRTAIPCVEERVWASVTLSSENPASSQLPIILDIDTYRAEKLTLSDRELWNLMDILRGIKNKAFFGSITEKTRELLR